MQVVDQKKVTQNNNNIRGEKNCLVVVGVREKKNVEKRNIYPSFFPVSARATLITSCQPANIYILLIDIL